MQIMASSNAEKEEWALFIDYVISKLQNKAKLRIGKLIALIYADEFRNIVCYLVI